METPQQRDGRGRSEVGSHWVSTDDSAVLSPGPVGDLFGISIQWRVIIRSVFLKSNFHLEIIVDSPVDVRLTLFSPMVTYCKVMVQYHPWGIDMDTDTFPFSQASFAAAVR